MDAAHYLNVHDPSLIFSWTPREFKSFIKGARLKQIDAFELSAANALFTAKAQSGGRKRIGLKDLYDGDKARKQVDSVDNKKEEAYDLTRFRNAKEAMKAWYANSLQKGG